MQVFLRQIYIELGASYPFSHIFQHRMSKEVGSRVVASENFKKKYGTNYQLGFNLSAKRSIQENEIRGPTVFKKQRDVEFTIFLPFDTIARKRDPLMGALNYLFQGVYSVLESLEIDTQALRESENSILKQVRHDPTMLKVS